MIRINEILDEIRSVTDNDFIQISTEKLVHVSGGKVQLFSDDLIDSARRDLMSGDTQHPTSLGLIHHTDNSEGTPSSQAPPIPLGQSIQSRDIPFWASLRQITPPQDPEPDHANISWEQMQRERSTKSDNTLINTGTECYVDRFDEPFLPLLNSQPMFENPDPVVPCVGETLSPYAWTAEEVVQTICHVDGSREPATATALGYLCEKREELKADSIFAPFPEDTGELIYDYAQANAFVYDVRKDGLTIPRLITSGLQDHEIPDVSASWDAIKASW